MYNVIRTLLLSGILLPVCCIFAEDNTQSLETFLLEQKEYMLELKPEEDSLLEKEYVQWLKERYKEFETGKDSEAKQLLLCLLEKKLKENNYCSLTDKKIFHYVFELCQKNDDALGLLDFFETQMVTDRLEQILNWFKTKKYPISKLYKLPVEILKRQEFSSYNQAAIEFYVQKVKQNPQGKEIYLRRRALLGDQKAKQIIINQAKQVLLDPEALSRNRRIISNLLALRDRDANIALLKLFQANIGAPEFYKEKTIRFTIMKGLFFQYPRDDFFKKYRQYIFWGISAQSVLPDSSFGSEDNIKRFFLDFKEWAKKRIGYELDFSNIQYKINQGNEIFF